MPPPRILDVRDFPMTAQSSLKRCRFSRVEVEFPMTVLAWSRATRTRDQKSPLSFHGAMTLSSVETSDDDRMRHWWQNSRGIGTGSHQNDVLNGKYVAWAVSAREKANLTCEMPKALVKHPMGGISVFCKDLEMAGQFLHATGQFMHVGQAATIFTMELPEALAEHIFQPGAALKLVTPATFCQSNNIIVQIPETPQQRQAGPQSIDKQVKTASLGGLRIRDH